MFCWLVFGDHAALRRGVWRAANVILTRGIQQSACRVCPTDDRAITPRASPWGGLNALLAYNLMYMRFFGETCNEPRM